MSLHRKRRIAISKCTIVYVSISSQLDELLHRCGRRSAWSYLATFTLHAVRVSCLEAGRVSGARAKFKKKLREIASMLTVGQNRPQIGPFVMDRGTFRDPPGLSWKLNLGSTPLANYSKWDCTGRSLTICLVFLFFFVPTLFLFPSGGEFFENSDR